MCLSSSPSFQYVAALYFPNIPEYAIGLRLFTDLNREQLGQAAADSLVVFPIGATEQHGPHLPTGTDFYTVETICREAATRASGHIPVIVAPALPFGSSDHHLIYGGTMSLSTETYYKVLRELLESLVTDGFKRIFVVNGHGGNHEIAQLAVRDVALKHPVRAAAGSYWVIAWDALIGVEANKQRWLPGHAGDFETSMMMSLRGDIVPQDRPHRDETVDTDPRAYAHFYRHERHGFWRDINGFTDSPDRATKEKGDRDRAAIVSALSDAFLTFYRG